MFSGDGGILRFSVKMARVAGYCCLLGSFTGIFNRKGDISGIASRSACLAVCLPGTKLASR